MFSSKRSIIATAATVLSLALFASCKTSETKPKLGPVEAPSTTNQTAPPMTTIQPDSGDNMGPNILNWDATTKEYHAKAGEMSAPFTFSMTNISSRPVVIYDTETTCECTLASLPSKPWTVPSGGAGSIEAKINLSNKVGVATSSVIIFTSQGNRRLTLKVFVPEPNTK